MLEVGADVGRPLGPLGPAPVAGQEVDRGAAAGQRDSGYMPDSRGRPGDDDGLAVEAGGVRLGELG